MFGLSSSYSFCNPCNHFSRIGTSVSRWCPDDMNHCNQCCCVALPRYAHLTQTEAFSVAEDSPLPFNGQNVVSEALMLENGLLTLPGPGAYLVRYHVHVPATSIIDTTFVLRMDGEDVAGTARPVVKLTPNGAVEVVAEAVIEVCHPVTLGLYSTNAISLPADTTGEALATLTVTSLQ